MAAADQEARNVAILVAGRLDDRPRSRDVVDELDSGGDAAAPRCSPPTARCIGSDELTPPRPRGPPRARTARRSPSSTTTAGGCWSRWSTPDGTAVVRASVTERRAARGREPGLGGHHRPRPRPDGAGRARSPRGWAGGSASRCATWPRSRTGSARATCPRGPRSGAPRRPRSWPAPSTGWPSGPASCSSPSAPRSPTSRHRLRTPVTALRLDAEAVADPELARRLRRAHRRPPAQHRRDRARGPATGPRPTRRRLRRRRGGARAGGVLAGPRRGPGPPGQVELPDAPAVVPLAATTSRTSSTSWSTTSSRTRPSRPGFAVRLARGGGTVHARGRPTRARARPGGPPGPRPGSTGLGLDIARRRRRPRRRVADVRARRRRWDDRRGDAAAAARPDPRQSSARVGSSCSSVWCRRRRRRGVVVATVRRGRRHRRRHRGGRPRSSPPCRRSSSHCGDGSAGADWPTRAACATREAAGALRGGRRCAPRR